MPAPQNAPPGSARGLLVWSMSKMMVVSVRQLSNAYFPDCAPGARTPVDLCNTNVEEVPEFAFVHCTSLREILLPTTLHTIRIKAFMNCAALVELAIPPSLRYIGSGAFLDCTVFSRLAKMPGRHKWRGVYAEENAFAICPAMRWPPWLHMIPDMGYTPGLG